MAIPVDLITRKRLALTKQLYQQALMESASLQSQSKRIMSVIGFDLAVETGLKAVVAALTTRNPPAENFNGLIQQADDSLSKAGLNPVPDKAHIQHVHALRNDAQHKARYPNETEVSDCRTYVRDFLQKLISDVWALSFEELSLAEAIQNEEAREYLIAAEIALKDGDQKEAVVQAEMGFRGALELVEALFVGRLSLVTLMV